MFTEHIQQSEQRNSLKPWKEPALLYAVEVVNESRKHKRYKPREKLGNSMIIYVFTRLCEYSFFKYHSINLNETY